MQPKVIALSGWFSVTMANNVPFSQMLKDSQFPSLGSCCCNSLVSEGPAVIWALLLVGTENTRILKLYQCQLHSSCQISCHPWSIIPVSKLQMTEPSPCSLLLPGQAINDDSHARGYETQRDWQWRIVSLLCVIWHYSFACSLAFSNFLLNVNSAVLLLLFCIVISCH